MNELYLRWYDEIEGIKTAYLDEKERQADALAETATILISAS